MFLMTRIFHWLLMWKMDPMSGFDIRLVFTLPPSDSTLQCKRCVHLWNNFPCIKFLKISMAFFMKIVNWVVDWLIDIIKVMLQYHIQALHADCSVYTCPHCSDVTIPLDTIRLDSFFYFKGLFPKLHITPHFRKNIQARIVNNFVVVLVNFVLE